MSVYICRRVKGEVGGLERARRSSGSKHLSATATCGPGAIHRDACSPITLPACLHDAFNEDLSPSAHDLKRLFMRSVVVLGFVLEQCEGSWMNKMTDLMELWSGLILNCLDE